MIYVALWRITVAREGDLSIFMNNCVCVGGGAATRPPKLSRVWLVELLGPSGLHACRQRPTCSSRVAPFPERRF